MPYIYILFISAAVLGIIIALMEQEEFPGWGNMAICVLAADIPAGIIGALLPDELSFIGMLVGALCAAPVVSWLCGMTVKRAFIAMTIFSVIMTTVWLGFYFIMR